MRLLPALLFFLLLLLLGIYAVVVLTPREAAPSDLRNASATLEAPSPVTVLDPVRGNPGAATTLIEYGDFVCEVCRGIEPVLRELLARADIRLVWRDFPIEGASPYARQAATAARCAQDQGKFWEYHDALLSSDRIFSDAILVGLAQDLALDPERFQACLGSAARDPVVKKFQDEALALGLIGTPEFFINDKRYTGPLTAETLDRALRDAAK